MRSPTVVCAHSRRAEASSRRADIENSLQCGAQRHAILVPPGASLSTVADSTRHKVHAGGCDFGDTFKGRYPGQVVGSPAWLLAPQSTDPRSSTYGCRLRDLREGPRLRQVGV